MSTTTIAQGTSLCTLINVFTVSRDKQQELVNALVQVTDHVICTLPGFVSANIHKSVDGERVTNYVQWRSKEDLERMLLNPEAKEHIKVCQELASNIDFHLYTVDHVQGAM